jgi:RHH-type transcriptional regulator, rel operon repressor / antitoxin RelB
MNNAIESSDMADRATVTFHTTPETKERLDLLATITRRSKSYLTNLAVEQYLAEEEDFIADIQAGIADADAGRTVTTEELKQSLQTHIKAIGAGTKPV